MSVFPPSTAHEKQTARDIATVASRADSKQPSALRAGSFWRRQVLARLSKIDQGSLSLRDQFGELQFGEAGHESEDADIVVHNQAFYRRVALGGSLGAAESYMDGDWDASDLTKTLATLARNTATTTSVEGGLPRLTKPIRLAANWLKRNTLQGSRRNIAQHYDLSNEFFELMLDPTMTYSSGYFNSPTSTLEQASTEKYDRICRKLNLGVNDNLLEIGTGWGGFALHAARHYGCHVTTTTISQAQHDYAADRFRVAGLQSRITLLQQDYRDLTGNYDKLVSIEMIEAVGEKYLPTFFAQCSRLLKPNGAMMLQAITMPDCRYDEYRHSVDFIQRYIFPGGFLPSPGVITDCLKRRTDFRLQHVEDFAAHYARTLAAWRVNAWGQLDDVRALGFDERFLRMWDYYLSYCQAGFLEQLIGVSQWMMTKPGWRPAFDSSTL